MVPPLRLWGSSAMPLSQLANTTAPLSSWQIYTSTDTATECTDFQAGTIRLSEKEKLTYNKDGTMTEKSARAIELAIQIQNSKCIASDDPRLKQ